MTPETRQPSVEYKSERAEPNDVMAVITEQAIDGWEPVCVYPTSLKGESTMYLMVTRVQIVFRRVT